MTWHSVSPKAEFLAIKAHCPVVSLFFAIIIFFLFLFSGFWGGADVRRSCEEDEDCVQLGSGAFKKKQKKNLNEKYRNSKNDDNENDIEIKQ